MAAGLTVPTADLTGETIASTYDQLLILDSTAGMVNTTLKIVSTQTGRSALQITNDQVLIKDASTVDIASCFEVQDKDGTVCLSVDGTNNRVGIGTATPVSELHVEGAVGAGVITISNLDTDIQDTNVMGSIQFRTNDGATSAPTDDIVCKITAIASGAHTAGVFPSDIAFYVTAANALTERMRIAGNGYVGIGTAASGAAPSEKLHVYENNATNFAGRFHNDGNNANRYGVVISCGLDTPASLGDCAYLHFHDGNGSARGGIHSSGTPNNPVFFNASDKRMKKDIAPTAIKGLDTINALTLSEWNWNHPTITNPKQDIGIVADDLEKVLPEEVCTKEMAGWEHLGDAIKAVTSETKLSFIMMKAMQELSAKVTALENA